MRARARARARVRARARARVRARLLECLELLVEDRLVRVVVVVVVVVVGQPVLWQVLARDGDGQVEHVALAHVVLVLNARVVAEVRVRVSVRLGLASG